MSLKVGRRMLYHPCLLSGEEVSLSLGMVADVPLAVGGSIRGSFDSHCGGALRSSNVS